MERVPFTATNNANPYDNIIITDDGRFWAGGAPTGGGDHRDDGRRANKLTWRCATSKRTRPLRQGPASTRTAIPGSAAAAARCSSSTSRRRSRFAALPYVMPTRPCRTSAARCGPAGCAAAAWCASIRRPTIGPSTCCPSPQLTTGAPGSTTPPRRSQCRYVDHNSYLVRVPQAKIRASIRKQQPLLVGKRRPGAPGLLRSSSRRARRTGPRWGRLASRSHTDQLCYS